MLMKLTPERERERESERERDRERQTERERVEKKFEGQKSFKFDWKKAARPNCDVKSTKQEKQIIFRKVKKQFKIFSCLIHKVSNKIKIPHLL